MRALILILALVAPSPETPAHYRAAIDKYRHDRIAELTAPDGWLDAPVRRVAALDSFVAYAPELEDVILPQSEGIAAAMEELLGW